MKKNILLMIVVDFIILLISLLTIVNNNSFFVDRKNKNIIALNESEPLTINKVNKKYYTENTNYIVSDNKNDERIINCNNKTYELIELNIENIDSYLLIIYKPEKIKLMMAKRFNTGTDIGLEKLTKMVERYDAIAGINGGGFFDAGDYATDTPIGYIIQDGKVIYGNLKRKGRLIGFNNNNELVMINATGEEAINMGVRDAMEFGPFLMVNGEITKEAERMENQVAARTVIAQRQDGIVLMLVTSGGTHMGPRMSKILNIIKDYGGYNAANLDGGASSQLVVDGKLYTTSRGRVGNIVRGGRRIINGWGIIE